MITVHVRTRILSSIKLLALPKCICVFAAYENYQDPHHHHPHKNIIMIIIHFMYGDDDDDEDFCKFNHLAYTTKLHTYRGIFLCYAFSLDNMHDDDSDVDDDAYDAAAADDDIDADDAVDFY